MVGLKMKYGEENVILFKHSKEGLDYVLSNLGRKMVVLLDRNFHNGKEMDGIEVFEKIREKTSLVYVILVTVSKISEISGDILKKLINKDLFKLESFTQDYKKKPPLSLVPEKVIRFKTKKAAAISTFVKSLKLSNRNRCSIFPSEYAAFHFITCATTPSRSI